MSISVMLDADANLSRERAEEVLRACGAGGFTDQKYGFSAAFPQSGMPVYYTVVPAGQQPDLREMTSSSRPVFCTVSFKILNSTYELCYAQIFEVISSLQRSSPGHLVLSQQRDYPLAVRDEAGLRFFKEHWPPSFAPLEKST